MAKLPYLPSDLIGIPIFVPMDLQIFVIIISCISMLSDVLVGNAPVVVGVGIFRVESNGLVIVLNSTLILAKREEHNSHLH